MTMTKDQIKKTIKTKLEKLSPADELSKMAEKAVALQQKRAAEILAEAKAITEAEKAKKLQARKDAKKAKRAEKTAVKTKEVAAAREGTVGKAEVIGAGGKSAWRKVKKAIQAGILPAVKVQGEWTIKTTDFETFDLSTAVRGAGTGKTSKIKRLEEQLAAANAIITTLGERITLLEMAAYEEH